MATCGAYNIWSLIVKLLAILFLLIFILDGEPPVIKAELALISASPPAYLLLRSLGSTFPIDDFGSPILPFKVGASRVK